MKFSYFNKGRSRFGLTSIARGFTATLSTLAPKFSALLGENVLMKPYSRRSYDFEHIKPKKELNLLTSMGVAHVNLFGSGERVVIVSHGWGDTSNSFEQMILSLTQQGYTVAAIDHIGHGKSSGNNSHLLSFIETLELLLEQFNEERIKVDAIIGHSMGAIAALNLPNYLLESKKIILISSPIKFFELMFEKVEQAGISRKLLTRVLESISHKHGKTWQQLTTENNRDKLALNLTFIHDRQDRYAPFEDLTQYLQQEKNTLIETQGLGHRRILSDTSVINNIAQVLSA
ncbi:alpha/beta hydrolase [Colwellia sp. 12G3]|uniref:alpha/beta hydrolase n=1 Tax=Colwellia sp. 12G3 TaxID=2058299 RepID=UPI000C34D246|nr:alpha/beta fold hydrolase [Colwellia sp. 12G3]PKI14856.1 alpha/beta hydrolase [Colwellia sp. 12G3]